MDSFKDKIVVITGASRGIGRQIALAFGAEGAQVACVATTEPAAKATADMIGPSAKGYACDVSDAASVESLFAKIQADL